MQDTGSSGEDVELDYAILKLETAVEDDKILPISINNKPLQYTFIGYDAVESLRFTNYSNKTDDPYEELSTHQETLQETGFGLSGSAYINENNQVYAIHQNTGLSKKESLYINTIFLKKPNSVLERILAGQDVKNTPLILADVNFEFPNFNASGDNQYDEGTARGQTLEKNPSVGDDYIKDQHNKVPNAVCQEVLCRWALKTATKNAKGDYIGLKKARYIGDEPNREAWIRDWKNWEVQVRKTDDGVREWVSLNPRSIQMGHKISAVSYWVYGYEGYKSGKETLLTNFFNPSRNPENKRTKYDVRYANYTAPGFKRAEDNEAIINRQFMYDASNYRFEWKKLNEAHGRQERKNFQYSHIAAKGARQPLASYRALRNDEATTPQLKADLIKRDKDLEQKIETQKHLFLKR